MATTHTDNLFKKLYDTDVSGHIEKKAGFSYLSWPFAVAELRKADPEATWEVMRFDGKPFCATECGHFVEVAVTAGGVTLSQIHPVLDNRNKPIPSPKSFDINTSIMRCLVKAIALHGLGLCVYAGEDLPIDNGQQEAPPAPPAPPADPKTAIEIERELKACKNLKTLGEVWKDNYPDYLKLRGDDQDRVEKLKDQLKTKLSPQAANG